MDVSQVEKGTVQVSFHFFPLPLGRDAFEALFRLIDRGLIERPLNCTHFSINFEKLTGLSLKAEEAPNHD